MKAILNDVTRCTGCETCIKACVNTNELEKHAPTAERSRPDHLSGHRLASIIKTPDGANARKSCLHCLEPACAEACLVGAIKKTPEGPVVYDADKCIGCRYCMLACPFGIPRYEWEKKAPYIMKCTMCADRLSEGKIPACVESCPHGAMLFGERDELLAEAHRRIKAKPDVYSPHVYGENEIGGTSVLYIAGSPLDVLGWPANVGEKSIPSFTWPVISATPGIAVGVASMLTGVSWIVHRRMKLATERAEQVAQDESKSGE